MLDLLPRALASLRLFTAEASKPDPVTTREQALVSLALAISANDTELVRRHILQAKQSGVTNEEIGQVTALVGSFALSRISLIQDAIAGAGTCGPQAGPVQQTCCR
jgi:hypothetical protein